ncbi:MAG: dTDP-4-dehydrorhamnose 3,5-epimerase [Candidatus Parvarchaeota archaeon]
MEFEFFEIEGLVLIKPRVFYDNRGFFMETYTKKDFEEHGIKTEFVQDNHSWSIKNTLRGLHFQKEPHSQAKLIRCISGEILDVAVDIRKNKKTFGKHVKINLSAENKNMLYIPEGFAHGFLVLSDYAEIIYKVSKFYNKESESGIIWNDPELAIEWPVKNPILSESDRSRPRFSEIKSYLR